MYLDSAEQILPWHPLHDGFSEGTKIQSDLAQVELSEAPGTLSKLSHLNPETTQ